MIKSTMSDDGTDGILPSVDELADHLVRSIYLQIAEHGVPPATGEYARNRASMMELARHMLDYEIKKQN